MKVSITKVDGTIDVFGAVMSFKYDAEANHITVTHGMPNGRLAVKDYSSGKHRSVEMDSNAPTEYSVYPSDSKIM